MKLKIKTKDGHEIVKLNRRKAIRYRCLNCGGWSPAAVRDCGHDDNCPLYSFRSGMGKQNAKARSKAIRAYCYWCCGYQSSLIPKCTVTDCPFFPYRMSKIDRSAEIK
jgi:hypothetical protein